MVREIIHDMNNRRELVNKYPVLCISSGLWWSCEVHLWFTVGALHGCYESVFRLDTIFDYIFYFGPPGAQILLCLYLFNDFHLIFKIFKIFNIFLVLQQNPLS